MRLFCTKCDAELPPPEDEWRCSECGIEASIAKACPRCGERIRLTASRCKHCDEQQPEPPPETAYAFHGRARLCLEAGKYEEAIEHFEVFLRGEPGRANAWLGKAQAHDRLGQRPHALRALRGALKRRGLGLSHRELNDARDLRNALAIRRRQLPPLASGETVVLACASCDLPFDADSATCARCGPEAEIATRCRRCERANPFDGAGCLDCRGDLCAAAAEQAGAAVARAQRMIDQGLFGQALRLFDAAVDVYPGSTDIYLGRARAQHALGYTDEAAASVSQAFGKAGTDAVLRAIEMCAPVASAEEEGPRAPAEHDLARCARAFMQFVQSRAELARLGARGAQGR